MHSPRTCRKVRRNREEDPQLPFRCWPPLYFSRGAVERRQQKYARYLQRGKKLLDRSNPKRAVLEFRSAIQLQPNEAEAYYWIAQAFLGENNVRDAVVALRKATELNPGYPAAQLKLAELMIRTRDEELLKDAELRIQKILTDNPGDDDALFTLAAAQAQLGRPEDAEKYLNEVLKRSPANLRSNMALALLKVAQKDLAGAEQILKGASNRRRIRMMRSWRSQPFTPAWADSRRPSPC